MITAWKKLINKGHNDIENSLPNGTITMPPGIHKLDKDLQRKFARGVHYNIKVVIKGDNRVGKTSLFLRLKGYGFEDNYVPTESLNVTSIDWNYKATDDVVKIDLWEAIDASTRKNVNFVDLKMENQIGNAAPSDEFPPNSSSMNPAKNHQFGQQAGQSKMMPPGKVIVTSTRLSPGISNSDPIPESAKQSLADLSANFDVYRGAHAVLLVMDMTKSWTFKYVQNEFPKIPEDIPVLVIANHRDQGHHRTVTAEQVKAFLEVATSNQSGNRIVMYTEASMRNGFGLKLIEKFFNIPYLKLQEAALLKQLELNRQDYSTTKDELQLLQATTDREYEQYLELETIKRRQQADAMSPVNNGLRQLDEATREQIRNSTMSCDTIDKNVKSIESNISKADKQASTNQKFVNDRMASIVIGAKCPLPESSTKQLFSPAAIQGDANGGAGVNEEKLALKKDANDEVVDSEDESDDEEEPRANPMVANYQSDLDSDDQIGTTS